MRTLLYTFTPKVSGIDGSFIPRLKEDEEKGPLTHALNLGLGMRLE